MKKEKWTKEQLQEHIKEQTSHYSLTVVVAMLYKKLYGEYPKIGMSGTQRDFAESCKDVLPEPKDKILDMVEIDEEKTEEMLRKVLAWTTEETNMDTDEILEEQARFLTEAGIIKVKNEKIL